MEHFRYIIEKLKDKELIENLLYPYFDQENELIDELLFDFFQRNSIKIDLQEKYLRMITFEDIKDLALIALEDNWKDQDHIDHIEFLNDFIDTLINHINK